MRLLFSKGVGFVAKPRCGSTLVRRTLNKFLEEGDISIDVGEGPRWHPHLPASQIRKKFLTEADQSSMELFTVTRHPVEMLRSYWNFFQPDARSRYTFDLRHEGNSRMDFDRWVVEGKLPVSSSWLEDAPPAVSPNNLSPLGLEFRVMNRAGENLVQRVFQLEEIDAADEWLSYKLGAQVSLANSPRVNASQADRFDRIGKLAKDHIRLLFPTEASLYNV